MAAFKKGQAVNATTIRGTAPVAGKIADVRETPKGDWYDVKPNNGGKTFSTRASKITAA